MSTVTDPTSLPIPLPSPAPPLRGNGDAPAATAPKLLAPPRKRRAPRVVSWAWKLTLLAAVAGMTVWAVARWTASGRDRPAEITAPVTRGTLPISVTERGEIESSKTVTARCEIEGHQNKIVEILAEGTRVTKGQEVVKFD